MSVIKDQILLLINLNPGLDAEDIATKLGIELATAVRLTDELLQEGLLDFDD